MFDKIKYRIKMLSILKPFAKRSKEILLAMFCAKFIGAGVIFCATHIL